MKSLGCRLALTLVALAGVAMAVTKWTVYSSSATFPNQGRFIMRSASNHALNLIFWGYGAADTALVYTRSTNGGTNWSSVEEIADDYYDAYSSLAMYDSFPWVATVYPTADEPDNQGVKGAVRTGGSWKTANVWNPDAGEAFIFTTSTASSPSSTTQMVYSAIAWSKYDSGNYTGWFYITFIAWDAQAYGGYPQMVYAKSIDSLYFASSTTYVPEASIAVSASGGYDTIHVAYTKRVSGTDQIFYMTTTGQVNPSRIRAGNYPTWATGVRISNGSSEAATQPSIDFDSSSSTLAVVWRGPNSTGGSTGDIWHATRVLHNAWNSPSNVTSTSTKESDRPEVLAGGAKTVYEEVLSGTNWEVYFDWSGNKRNVSSTTTPSRDPHFASRGDTFYIVWTEDSTGHNYRVTFARYLYVPDKMGGGGEGGRLVPIPDRAVLELRSVPNPLRSSATLSYDLLVPSDVVLEVFAADGRRVRTLIMDRQDAGRHSVVWLGDGESGERVPEGLYVCRLRAGSAETATLTVVAR